MDAASRKSARADGGGSSSCAGDRLSHLPDALLHAILSFLRARQVVRTSVLSRRWRHLWRSVPCLDIDQREFAENERDKFEDFTDSLLAHRNGSLLDTFQLHISGQFLRRRIDATRWIRRGLKCSPKVLHFYNRVDFVAAPAIMPNLDSNACCLTKLHLYHVRLYDSFAEQISSVCVLLEVLELKICHLCFHEITFPTLKNLAVDNCIMEPFEGNTGTAHTDTSDRLSIMTPHLSHLHVVLNVNTEEFSLHALPSLVEAKICLEYNRYEKMLFSQWELLSSLFNTTTRELSGLQKLVMPFVEPVDFPTFNNLRSLLLDKCDLTDDVQLLTQFLQKSPNLEKLTVRSCKFSIGSSQCVNLVDLQCGKPKSTEIIYVDDDNFRELVNVMMDISGKLPKNTVTLTRVLNTSQSGYHVTNE